MVPEIRLADLIESLLIGGYIKLSMHSVDIVYVRNKLCTVGVNG